MSEPQPACPPYHVDLFELGQGLPGVACTWAECILQPPEYNMQADMPGSSGPSFALHRQQACPNYVSRCGYIEPSARYIRPRYSRIASCRPQRIVWAIGRVGAATLHRGQGNSLGSRDHRSWPSFPIRHGIARSSTLSWWNPWPAWCRPHGIAHEGAACNPPVRRPLSTLAPPCFCCKTARDA